MKAYNEKKCLLGMTLYNLGLTQNQDQKAKFSPFKPL